MENNFELMEELAMKSDLKPMMTMYYLYKTGYGGCIKSEVKADYWWNKLINHPEVVSLWSEHKQFSLKRRIEKEYDDVTKSVYHDIMNWQGGEQKA